MRILIAILNLLPQPAPADVVRMQNDVAMTGIIEEDTEEGLSLRVGADSTVFIPRASILAVERKAPAENKALRSRWARVSPTERPLPTAARPSGTLTLYQGEWLDDEELDRRLRFDDADLGSGRFDGALVSAIRRLSGAQMTVSGSAAIAQENKDRRTSAHARHWSEHTNKWRHTPLVRYNTALDVPYNATTAVPDDDRAAIPYDNRAAKPRGTAAAIPDYNQAAIPYNTGAFIPYDTRAAIPYNTRAAIPYNTRSSIPYNSLPAMRSDTAPEGSPLSTPSHHRRTKHRHRHH
ncbi:MAG: hypothetical protein HY926_09835 [Elusimicrobia bacterium]|nr:hypothetical protein [Elusimicrobiota bacterium]